MSTLQEVIDRAREEWLQDSAAKEWVDARLVRAGNDAHRWLASRMANIRGSRWFSHTETFNVTGETYSLSSLAYPFVAMRALFHVKSTGIEVPMEPSVEGDESRGRGNLGSTPDQTPSYFILQRDAQNRNLHFLPVANRTFRAVYQYAPPILVIGGDLLTPDIYDDLVAAELARRAILAESEEDAGLTKFIDQRLVDMMEDVHGAANQASSRYIRDVYGGGW